MDETALAAELLAEKFSSGAHSPSQTHLTHPELPLQEPLYQQLHPDSLPLADQPDPHDQVATTTTFVQAAGAPPASTTTFSQASNTNAPAVTNGETPSEPVQAYAKLEGDSFCYYIRTLQVTFGRKASSSDHVDIHLGPTKAISRQHARLFYNFTTQRFEMMVFGKNGAFVNDQFVEKGVTVPLENRTKIQIGEVSFSFLLPKIESDAAAQDAAHPQGSSQKINGASNQAKASSSSIPSIKKEVSSQPPEHFDASEYSSRETKPPFSYASLIAQAINTTTLRKLTLNGIYQHITHHYPYYQMAQNGWQNSIRHNLSLNKAFVKVPRSDNEPGKGAFWTIDQGSESQFTNGVYKRNRRAMSSKSNGERSESPFDHSDGKPRKRLNTGTEGTASSSAPTQASLQSTIKPSQFPSQVSSSTLQSSATTATATTAAQPDYSHISEASLKLAALLQQNPGMLALNLATLTQSLSAANKEGAQNAVLTALLSAARASSAQAGAGVSSTLPATARALATHLQQQQQQQTSAGAGSTAGSSTTQVSSAQASGITQSLVTLQAIAQAIATARSNAAATAAAAAGTTTATTSATASPVLSTTSTPTMTASLAGSLASLGAAGSSPIAQLVAAAQAQARALAQAQSLASPPSLATTAGTGSTSTPGSMVVSPSIPAAATSVVGATAGQTETDMQAQLKELQARTVALAQAQQAVPPKETQEVTSAPGIIVVSNTTPSPVVSTIPASTPSVSASTTAAVPSAATMSESSAVASFETPDASASTAGKANNGIIATTAIITTTPTTTTIPMTITTPSITPETSSTPLTSTLTSES